MMDCIVHNSRAAGNSGNQSQPCAKNLSKDKINIFFVNSSVASSNDGEYGNAKFTACLINIYYLLNKVLQLVLLFVSIQLFALGLSRQVHAGSSDCSSAQEAAFETINNAFSSKVDLLLLLGGALVENKLDPHAFPIIGSDGSLEVFDLPNTIMKLTAGQVMARKLIETETQDCFIGKIRRSSIDEVATYFSTTEISDILPDSFKKIDFAQLLDGHLLGSVDALTPAVRSDILSKLGIGGDAANIIRDPICVFRSCDSRLSALDTGLQKLVASKVTFDSPEHMKIGQSIIIQVKFSTNLPQGQLQSLLTTFGRKEISDLSVSDRLAATLNGGAAFNISPSGQQIQRVRPTRVTTWTWNITPKLTGSQYLMLSFDAMIFLDGKDGMRNVNTLIHKIDVDVGWPQTPSEWFDYIKNRVHTGNWLWAVTLVLTGIRFAKWKRRPTRDNNP